MIEEWKAIDGYASVRGFTYEVSNWGRVRNAQTLETRNQITDEDGYRKVTLQIKDSGGSLQQLRVHRLVALYFIPNPENLETVDHIDEQPDNNQSTNLRWMTRKDNLERALKKQQKRVAQIDINTEEIIQIFESKAEAGRYTKVSQSNIGMALRWVSKVNKKLRGKAGGYYWVYLTEGE